MALDSGGAGPKKRRHWAYIRVGYKGTKMVKNQQGKWVPDPHATGHGAAVMRWVRVGSPLYRTLRSKGIKPYAIRAGKRPNSGTRPPKGSTPGNPSGKPMSPKGVKPGKAAVKPGTPAKVKMGGGGGKANRRKGGCSQTQRAVGQQLGKTSTGKKLGANYGENAAGMQFDAPIHDLKTLIARLGPQNTQAINDLTQWFGQVSQLNDRAGARAGDITEGVAGRQDAAVGNLMAALGGGANDANAALAQSNLRDTGYERALGGIEQQYHADMDPILAHVQASAKEQEQRRNLQQMQDYQLQLADLMGQRGQAKVAGDFEATKYNNDLAQQWFQNKLAKLNSVLGAESAGVDLRAKKAALRQQSKQSSGKFVPWHRLNPMEKEQILSAAIYAPDGHKRTLAQARSHMVSLGYAAGMTSQHNPAVMQALRSYYQNA